MSDVALEGFGGGGGTSLNFNVKDYATEELLMAAKGKVNEIGIITSIPMTGWYMAAEQPENLQPGEVWISTGTASQVAFNALKKNCIKVYPIKAMQMVGGVLVKKTAKSWNDNGWAEWCTYLLQNGVDATEITGGWKATNATAANTGYICATHVNFENGLLHIYTDNEYAGRYGMGTTVNTIDLTNATILHIKVADATNYFPAQVGAWSITGTSATLAAGKTDITGGCEVEVDVSALSGSYYIGALIGLKSVPSTKAVARIYLSDVYWR